jgi:hypothetical protein
VLVSRSWRRLVTVQAKNLGPASRSSLAAAAPPPVSSPVPVRNVALLLEQCSRRWNLGVADATAPDLHPLIAPSTLPMGAAMT